MWLTDLFSKKSPLWGEQLWNGQTDYHCHLLPGVDDGVKEMSETLQILEQYEAWGVQQVWCTPHIMEDIPNRTDDLRRRFEVLLHTYKGKIKLHLAAENMMDALFLERLQAKDFLPIGEHGDMLLVETSYYNPPAGFEMMLKQVQSAGFHPLLAHPERYLYMSEKQYLSLKNLGVRFQLNIGSLIGTYGETARKKATSMLDKGMYDCWGSDIHRYKMLENPAEVTVKELEKIRSVVQTTL